MIERTCSRSGAFVESLEESRVLVLYTGGTLGMKRDETGTLNCEKGTFISRSLHNKITYTQSYRVSDGTLERGDSDSGRNAKV